MERLRTHRWTVATAVVVVAMLVPVALDRDDFPLSTYPMYSTARPGTVVLPTVVAVDGGGDRRALSLAVVGGVDDPLIVASDLRRAIATGRADDRCAEVAKRLASSPDGADDADDAEADDAAVAVEVATERHDVVARVRGEPSEVGREVHARCPVGGPG